MRTLLRTIGGLYDRFGPPPQWRIPVLLAVGSLFGIGLLTLYVGNATSYLSDDPRACMNCHVMAPQFATWERSSHARVTVCNDCHVPHDNAFMKYAFKAMDGSRHSFMFTFRMEPQVIRIHDAGTAVVQQNCIRCHSSLTQNVAEKLVTLDVQKHGGGKLCWECHRETPHGRVNSLSSVPYARVPIPSAIVPEWLKKDISTK
ncbi:MAG: cytochrome c nitrite reductase small subunit [Bacteroidetes bacterium]|nr:cytochrome c nitrite reductase small subunit [Bacteroidota bacterium]